MSGEGDELLFLEDEDEPADALAPPPLAPWRILVVDDDDGVHIMTRLALDNFRFHDRAIELLSAYSATEALKMLGRDSDVALAFVDVVMETDNAGLDLVRKVRDDLGNLSTRIILRTGQPGQAPEPQVVVAYDINDYKSKTELTHRKLFSCTVAALRAYEHLIALEASRQGLRRILDVSSALFRHRTLRGFAAGVLRELVAMTGSGSGAMVCRRSLGAPASAATLTASDVTVLSATFPVTGAAAAGPTNPVAAVLEALRSGANGQGDGYVVLHLRTPNRRDYAVYLPTPRPPLPETRFLLEIFLDKIAVGFDTLDLWDQLRTAHKATVVALTDVAEGRDTDTGEHVLRVAELAERIARRLRDSGQYLEQLDEPFLEHVGTASMLHDVGKVAIPDRILLKPGPLDPEERAVMETHAAAGGQMLAKAARMVEGNTYLQLGHQIALCHHEWFDGSGYPQKLAGQAIPLAARIAALADVFDALSHARPYKKPWPREQVVAHIGGLSGRQFDPLVVAALFEEIAATDR